MKLARVLACCATLATAHASEATADGVAQEVEGRLFLFVAIISALIYHSKCMDEEEVPKESPGHGWFFYLRWALFLILSTTVDWRCRRWEKAWCALFVETGLSDGHLMLLVPIIAIEALVTHMWLCAVEDSVRPCVRQALACCTYYWDRASARHGPFVPQTPVAVRRRRLHAFYRRVLSRSRRDENGERGVRVPEDVAGEIASFVTGVPRARRGR